MLLVLMAIRLIPIKRTHTRRSQYARWILKKSRLVIVFVLIPKHLPIPSLQVLLSHTLLIVSTMKPQPLRMLLRPRKFAPFTMISAERRRTRSARDVVFATKHPDFA